MAGAGAPNSCTSKLSSCAIGVVKQRKYQSLPVPVLCEWTSTDSTLGLRTPCGLPFTDVPTFSSHVMEHIPEAVPYTCTCSWSGCDFIASTGETYVQHVLFHPFHAYLKVLGRELQVKFKLPDCQMDEDYKNLVPAITAALICQWNDGKCSEVFQCVGVFYNHVRKHVMSEDIQSSHTQCKWKGDCIMHWSW